MINARGAVADAIKRYDPALRARWSNQKQAWCIDYPVKRADMRVPPVRYERMRDGTWKEHLLPEDSEEYILYHSKREAVLYTRKLTNSVLARIMAMDGHRKKLTRAIREQEERARKNRQHDLTAKIQKGASEGYDFLKFQNKKNPNGAPDAILTKEERIAIEANGEKKIEKLLEDA